ncbi:MAG TPA: GNAT family N-acetyltransferase [Thermoleophilia bacterium]|nr:GNAT family N-acetyltransferase [Thermoleophilia bacterium]
MSDERARIRPCTDADLKAMVAVVNAAATAYAGVIPADRYHEPYMPREELCAEIAAGVRFWGLFEARGPRIGLSADDSALAGVMGVQDAGDVTLIRHAYVRPDRQRTGVGGRLLAHLLGPADVLPARPLLVGTWAAAWWAVAFYERHGFVLVTPEEKDRLLRRYWSIPERQVETSVVLRFAPVARVQR